MTARTDELEEAIARAIAALPPDGLNAEVGVLVRREIEARILSPLVAALEVRCGGETVREVLRRVIEAAARRQGADLARRAGGRTLEHFRRAMEPWMRGGAIEVETLAAGEDLWAYRVRRCRYAEMYHALGIPGLGAILSCARDGALVAGFNPGIRLDRGPTILEGAASCEFRYRLPR